MGVNLQLSATTPRSTVITRQHFRSTDVVVMCRERKTTPSVSVLKTCGKHSKLQFLNMPFEDWPALNA